MTSIESAGPVEKLLDINQQILEKEAKLSQKRLLRRLARIATLLGPAILLLVYISTYLTWQQYNLAPINVILIPSGALMVAGAISFYYDEISPEGVSVSELQLDLTLLQERKRIRAAELQLSSRYRRSGYKEEISYTLDSFRHESARYRRIHNYLQSIVIIGSLATTAFAGVAVDTGVFRWAAATSSFAVGVSAGFTGYYKFRERSFYLQQTADSIEQEWTAFELSIGRYSKLDDAKALGEFVEEIERLKAEQRKREQNLDQPSEQKQPTD
jgi:hypothetical protein